MSKLTLTCYGALNFLINKNRKDTLSSQYLKNLKSEQKIYPKDSILIDSICEFETEDKNGIIGFYSSGEYFFFGIGKNNKKCLIKTNLENILVYSKGYYDVDIRDKDIKKIHLKSKNNLSLRICYKNFQINKIINIIFEYFKDDKIVEILNLTDNLDENWNDILSLSLNNSIKNNDFSNPTIKIINQERNNLINISEISNKYNFKIIYDAYLNNNNKIIDNPKLICIISQDHHDFDINKININYWILNYIENFTLSHGKFFTYFEENFTNQKERQLFIDFLIAHKITSLYLKINSENEIHLINTLNEILESNSSSDTLIKNAIKKYGLVNENKNVNYYYYYY